MKRAASFISKLILKTIILSAILFALYYISKDESNVFFMQLVTGITVGTILLLIFIFIFPLFTKKVDTKYYLKNIILGIIASFVFYISQTIYQYFEKLGKFYMIISILTVTIIVFIIIEIMPLAFKSEKKEVEFRTAILGCIASGLIFSIVLNLTFIAMDYFKIAVK
jgi:TRAP-type uncharacterized transport system fused permease subunit